MNNRWRQIRRVRRQEANRQIRRALERARLEKPWIDDVRKYAHRIGGDVGILVDYLLVRMYGSDEL